MSIATPMERVFSDDKLLLKILSYSASKETWQSSRNLNLVCKRWRLMAFGPLCQSILPKICIGRCPSPISCSLMHLDTFKNRYMTYGSIMMCLGRPYLPIAVAINGLPTKKDVKFLREYCNKIGSLEINLLSNSDAITNRPLPNIFFQMESLRSLVVTWGDGKSAHNYILQEFLRGVLKSKRITMVKYIYPLCSLSEYIPEAPEKITHLEVTGTCNNLLGIVLTPTPRLQSFQLNLSGVQGNYAIPILNHFLERTCHTLEKLQIKHKNAQMFRGHIRIPYIQRLTSLEVEIPFIFISQQPMRKLQNMESFLSRKQRMCSTKILRPKVSKASLDLNWKKWNYISPLESAAKLEKMYEDNYLKNLELPNLGNAANIEEVSLNNLPFHVALGIMPKIYISILNISRLTLNLRRSLAVSSFATADTNYLMEILTGFIQSDIPFDPRRWPNMLTNKNNAITTLKSLSYLELETCERSNCLLGDFVFQAAFFQMKKLKRLRIKGGIQVDDAMVKEWIKKRRSIVIQ